MSQTYQFHPPPPSFISTLLSLLPCHFLFLCLSSHYLSFLLQSTVLQGFSHDASAPSRDFGHQDNLVSSHHPLCNSLTLLSGSASPVCVCAPGSHLSGLLGPSLRVCFHLVAGVTRNLGNGLFKDGRRLSDWQGCVQVRFTSLDETETESACWSHVSLPFLFSSFPNFILCSYIPSLPPFIPFFLLLSFLSLLFPSFLVWSSSPFLLSGLVYLPIHQAMYSDNR